MVFSRYVLSVYLLFHQGSLFFTLIKSGESYAPIIVFDCNVHHASTTGIR
jgi:hypothetical protein